MLISLIVSLFFCGCSEKNEKLVFAVGGAPSEVDYWETLVREFQNNTGIKVDLIRQPTDSDQRRQNLVIPLKAGESDPDVFLMDVAWVGQFLASGWLASLNGFMKNDAFETDPFFQPVIQQVDTSTNGNLIALPVYLDCGLLYYRKDLLEKYGLSVPQTWSQLVESSLAVQKEMRKDNPDFYGYVWQGAQYEGLICNFLEFISSAGGGLEKNGALSIHTPENINGLEFMHDLIHEHEISPPNTFTEMKEEEVRSYFQTGNALYERNWPYAWSLHQQDDSPVKGKTGVAVLPRFKDGRRAATLGGWHIGISNFSDQKQNAWRLLKFVVSYETQKKVALRLGWNPGRKDIYDDEEIRSQMPHIKVLKKALEHSVARPTLPYYTRISSILQKRVNSVLAGDMNAETALRKAGEEIGKLADRYE